MRIYARSSKRVVSDGEQMGHTCSVIVFLSQRRCTDASLRDTAWVLTHALVNMTNTCLSSSFLRTEREFGSRFGPIAKWPFCIQTTFCKEPHFWLVAKNGSFPAIFPKPGSVKNQSYIHSSMFEILFYGSYIHSSMFEILFYGS